MRMTLTALTLVTALAAAATPAAARWHRAYVWLPDPPRHHYARAPRGDSRAEKRLALCRLRHPTPVFSRGELEVKLACELGQLR